MTKFLFLGPAELVVVVLLALLLFGGRKIPELMKGIGSGIKGFKDEMKGDPKPSSKQKDKDKKNLN